MDAMALREIFRLMCVQPLNIFVKITVPLMGMSVDVYLKTENVDCLSRMHADKESDIESGMYTRNARAGIVDRSE
jgi:hypothetical protein